MIGSLKIQEKHSFVDPKDEEADKEDYINNGRNDRAAVLNVYPFHDSFAIHQDKQDMVWARFQPIN